MIAGLPAFFYDCRTLCRIRFRGVAQPGRAPALGAGCRKFESCRPDHFKQAKPFLFSAAGHAFFLVPLLKCPAFPQTART